MNFNPNFALSTKNIRNNLNSDIFQYQNDFDKFNMNSEINYSLSERNIFNFNDVLYSYKDIDDIQVIFQKEGGENFIINCNKNIKVSTLIQKYRDKSKDYRTNINFVFNALSLWDALTLSESGIKDQSIIFVVELKEFKIEIQFILLDVYGGCPIFISSGYHTKLSELIQKYIDKSGLSKSNIKEFVCDSKKIDENKTVEETGLKSYSQINVSTKKKIFIIFIRFKKKGTKDNQEIKIECLKSEKIESLLYRFKKKQKCINIKFFYNSNILENSDLTVNEVGLKNNSIIIYEEI
jgi:hypothetical protein